MWLCWLMGVQGARKRILGHFSAKREVVAVACDMPHRENEERECQMGSGGD